MKNIYIPLLAFFILYSCLSKQQNELEENVIISKIINSLGLSKSEFVSRYKLLKNYKIHSLNVEVYTLKPYERGFVIRCLYDYNTKKVFHNYTNKYKWSYVNLLPDDTFHPYYSYNHPFQYLENYLNNSIYLENRMITYDEMDSLLIYPAELKNQSIRIYNTDLIKDEINKYRNQNDSERNIFINHYMINGLDFLLKKVNSSTDFIYKTPLGDFFLIEVNHGMDMTGLDMKYLDLDYHLDVYSVSSKSNNENLNRLLDNAGLIEEY